MPNHTMLQLIRKVFIAAMDLKEKYDRNSTSEEVKAAADVYLFQFNKLKSALPTEIMEGSALSAATYFVREQPTNCYSHVRTICHIIMFRVEDLYIKFSLEHHNRDFLDIFE